MPWRSDRQLTNEEVEKHEGHQEIERAKVDKCCYRWAAVFVWDAIGRHHLKQKGQWCIFVNQHCVRTHTHTRTHARARTHAHTQATVKKKTDHELLLPGTLFRMMFAPVPTMTIHFVLFVFVCPSLVLMWWRPCTLGHLSLTCVHKIPPSPPFNCFVPLSTLFHPFTTLSINLNFNVTFLFVITCFFVSYFASACMYIIVLVCCKITFGPVHPLRRTRKRLGQNRLWNEVWNCYCYSVCYFSCLRTIFLNSYEKRRHEHTQQMIFFLECVCARWGGGV